MIAALLALGLGAAPPPDPGLAIGQRLGESAVAAQGLQGPLDGNWTLKDSEGRPLLILELSDPPGGDGPPQGAWRPAGVPAPGDPDLGQIARLSRRGDRLGLEIADAPGGPIRIELRRTGRRFWRGVMIRAGRRRAVSLIGA